MKKIYSILKEIGIINTLRFNLYYLPFMTAMRFPFLVSRNVRIRNLKGNIKLQKPFIECVKVGFDGVGVFDNKRSRTIWQVDEGAKIIFNGKTTLGH